MAQASAAVQNILMRSIVESGGESTIAARANLLRGGKVDP